MSLFSSTFLNKYLHKPRNNIISFVNKIVLTTQFHSFNIKDSCKVLFKAAKFDPKKRDRKKFELFFSKQEKKSYLWKFDITRNLQYLKPVNDFLDNTGLHNTDKPHVNNKLNLWRQPKICLSDIARVFYREKKVLLGMSSNGIQLSCEILNNAKARFFFQTVQIIIWKRICKPFIILCRAL